MNLLCTLLTIGLPAIDESLDKLLVAMESFPNVAVLGDAVGLARVIGLCLALCVGSYECWMMMLGRRGMDVMKLLRIIGISLCISSSSWICSALQVPGKGLESATKAMAQSKNKEVAAFELKLAQKQSEYLDRLRAVQDSISTAKQIAAFPDVLLRHPCGAADIHGNPNDILSHHVRPFPCAAVEFGMEPVDVEIPFPLVVGLRNLYVPVLH